jgi:hypothetical protein
MQPLRACLFASWLTVVLLSGPAEAASFTAQLMGVAPHAPKTFACFGRVYDAAHLAAHLHQNVRAMRVLAIFYGRSQQSLQLRIGLEVRDAPETFSTVAECGDPDAKRHDKGIFCPTAGSDKPAGLILAGRKAILLTLPDELHLWRPGPARPQDTVDHAFHPDDKLFRLERTHLAQCTDQAIDHEEQSRLERDR